MKTCGLDVHKEMVFCAIFDGKDAVVKKYDTFTPDMEGMCVYILSQGVDIVAMESTGIYISAIRTVLRRRGMRAVVVNPYLIKQMPGRKSDVKDSVWIATLMYNRMLGDSFMPDGVLAHAYSVHGSSEHTDNAPWPGGLRQENRLSPKHCSKQTGDPRQTPLASYSCFA